MLSPCEQEDITLKRNVTTIQIHHCYKSHDSGGKKNANVRRHTLTHIEANVVNLAY